jgi:hypothetical protein
MKQLITLMYIEKNYCFLHLVHLYILEIITKHRLYVNENTIYIKLKKTKDVELQFI